ncbi:MAG: hypothetical protein JWO19_3817, partial [Bryobacterales bacterium]|nr:hypothetical protein [Bryobacterales bacterium]
ARTDIYLQHNLTSDLPAHAEHTDPNLVNAWGISFPPTGPFWISDNHTGLATLYNGKGEPFPVGNPLVVTIPPPTNGTPPAAPTGQVFHAGPGFEVQLGQPALFIFATEDGTISGWNPMANATRAILKVDNSASGAVYKGLALASANGVSRLYATNFFAGTVDIFDSNFAPVTLSGAFHDFLVPTGFAPFNIQNIDGKLWVTYAKQDDARHDDVKGIGNGFVNVFDFDGKLLQRFVQHGPLNSPWGLAKAPAAFGAFSGAILVGNFGDGRINAFDAASGLFLGSMLTPSRTALEIDGLWALTFGNGANAGDTDKLYFTAGPDGEQHGLFGEIRPQHP